MKVYEALAKAFVGEGTTAVFGLMGDANMYWMNALHDLGISVHETRHEGDAVAMADAWAHQSDGQPGVCSTTSGPGTTQTATSLVVASRGHSPLVAFCGEAPVNEPDYIQAFDHRRFAAAVECGYVFVEQPDAAFDAVRKAFYLARVESRPIMLGSPMDTQQKPFDDVGEYVPSSTLFTGNVASPHAESLNAAANIICNSNRPVIIAGIGAKYAHAEAAIRQLANNTGAIISTSMVAKNWLGDDDYHVGIAGLYATRAAMELFQEADCVIAIGASMNNFTTLHGYLFPNAKYVQFDSKSQIVMGEGRSADCFVQADARLGIVALNEVLEARSFRQSGFRTAEVKEQLAVAHDNLEKVEIEPGELDPRDICRTLDESVPDDIGLIIGAGHATNFAIMLLNRQRPFINMRKDFGCIGQGLAYAIGTVTAHGNAPAILVDGDASFMMHLGEFETAVRYQKPLLVCILNDQALGSEYHKSVAHGLNAELSEVSTPNLGAVGVALGGRGHLVRTLDELRSACAEFAMKPGPMLLDIRISRAVRSIPMLRKEFGREDM